MSGTEYTNADLMDAIEGLRTRVAVLENRKQEPAKTGGSGAARMTPKLAGVAAFSETLLWGVIYNSLFSVVFGGQPASGHLVPVCGSLAALAFIAWVTKT